MNHEVPGSLSDLASVAVGRDAAQGRRPLLPHGARPQVRQSAGWQEQSVDKVASVGAEVVGSDAISYHCRFDRNFGLTRVRSEDPAMVMHHAGRCGLTCGGHIRLCCSG